MAYIPPHKRHSKDSDRPSPTPELLAPQLETNLNLRSVGSDPRRRKDKHLLQGGKIVYSDYALSRWFAVGLDDDNQFPSSARFEPICVESFERRSGEKPLALVIDSLLTTENDKVKATSLNTPWVSIAENVQQDLVSFFDNVLKEMEGQKLGTIKPTLVARFGKILFLGGQTVNLDTVKSSSVAETTLRKFKRSFYTNLPHPYMEHISNETAQKIGLKFQEERELYHVKLSDRMHPGSTISCKCIIVKDQRKLELYKIELNQVRHLVVDISCLGRNQDLRLMLCTKRIMSDLTEDEKQSMRSLISSAVIDPDVKGGLRWPLGKESSGDRYTVIGVWHTNSKTFRSASMRLKVRNADRFDFRSSAGEVTGEVAIKLLGIVSLLQDEKFEMELLSEMLKQNIKMVWNHFL